MSGSFKTLKKMFLIFVRSKTNAISRSVFRNACYIRDHNIPVTFDILVYGDNFAAHQKVCKQVECALLLNLKI